MSKPQTVHLMVDLETLDTAPTAHVLSASVVMFDPITGYVTGMAEHVETLTDYNVINWAFRKQRPMNFGLAKQAGATVSTGTLSWWHDTNKEYFDELISDASAAGMAFEDFIRQFNGELYDLITVKELDVCVWCTGTFDLDILRSASKRYGIEWAVPYWAYKDVRVARQMAEDFELIGDMEASHNAYEDCLRQIKYVSAVYGKLNNAGSV